MFTIREKIALGITGVEAMFICIGGCLLKQHVDNQYLDKYGMTAKEYVDTVMNTKSVEDYQKRLSQR